MVKCVVQIFQGMTSDAKFMPRNKTKDSVILLSGPKTRIQSTFASNAKFPAFLYDTKWTKTFMLPYN